MSDVLGAHSRKDDHGDIAAEFAEHGIAGARLDRIAATAKSNKAQTYHYFTSKEALFDAVLRELAETFVRESPSRRDEPAGERGPPVRPVRRQRDRRPAGHVVPARAGRRRTITGRGLDSTRQKVEAGWSRPVPAGPSLLALVVHLSTLWHSATPDMATITEGLSREQRRPVVTTAVAALPRD
jgi:AcrR family transcriptional regulator